MIFVVTIEAGRVRGEDVATINLVLKAINHKVHYGVIVNKVTKVFVEKMKKEDARKAVFAGLNSGEMKTDHIYYMLRDDDIEDQDNKIPNLTQEIVEFIYKQLPYTVILKKNVRQVDTNQFKEIERKFKEQIFQIEKDAKMKEKVYEDSLAQLRKDKEGIFYQQQKQAEEFNKQIQQLEEKMGKEREESRLLMLQEQKKYEEMISKANQQHAEQLKQQHETFQQYMEKEEERRKEMEERMYQQIIQLQNKPPQVIEKDSGVLKDLLGFFGPIIQTAIPHLFEIPHLFNKISSSSQYQVQPTSRVNNK